MTGLVTTPAATLSDPVAGINGYGSGAASVADVNGDGFADVAVGAYHGSTGGRLYVYFGRASGLSAAPSVSWVGPDGTGDDFGLTVAELGLTSGVPSPSVFIANGRLLTGATHRPVPRAVLRYQ